MLKIFSNNSIGIVKAKKKHFNKPLKLECGKTLLNYDIVYETYGKRNVNNSNAILICHALSGNHHAAGYYLHDKKPGWWNFYIGPNKSIDTKRFFIISINNLGGCHGSTGPISLNKNTGNIWGPLFPLITIKDWVKSQVRLADKLNIKRFVAIIGGSLGGMQVLEWSIRYPHRIKNAIIIASTTKLSTQNIAFNEIARQAIRSDPNFHNGWYKKFNVLPKNGLKLARMIGHITYLSENSMKSKFGRKLLCKINFKYDKEFLIESYLRYQGNNFSNYFDANTYLLMTKALDYFDPASAYNGSLAEAVSSAKCKYLIISFTSDWRFSPKHSYKLVNALINSKKKVNYINIKSSYGHDAFLLPNKQYEKILKNFLNYIK